MAGALTQRHASEAAAAISVASASVDAERRTIHPMIVQLLADRQIALDPATASTALSQELVDEADLILTMTGDHAIAVAGRFRQATAKVFMLDHFAQLAEAGDRHEPIADLLARLKKQPRNYPNPPAAQDITDPIGRDDATFRQVADQLDQLTRRVVEALHQRSEA